MTRDYYWSCKRAEDCGGFTLETVDATAAEYREYARQQQAHLEWHEDHNAIRRAQAAEAHGVTA